MERSLSGMLFLIAAVAISLSAGAWWLQRIAFTPDDTRDTAAAILEAPDIRLEINSVVTPAAAPVMNTTVPALGTFLEEEILTTRAGAAMMGPLIEEIHHRIIGNSDQPIRITGPDMIEIVRDERAADAPTVTMPIDTIGTLRTFRQLLGWIIPITAVLGVIVLLLGIFARPERRDILRGLGEFGLALTISILMFGYLIPVHLLTAIDNRTWTHAIPQLALRTLPVVLGTAAIFALAGLAMLFASTSGGKRRQWSTPLSVARYRGGDNPGWG